MILSSNKQSYLPIEKMGTAMALASNQNQHYQDFWISADVVAATKTLQTQALKTSLDIYSNCNL